METVDYLVIGAGTAGCLLANRLSRSPATQVLLVEAGGRDNYPWIHIPVGYLHCIDNPRTDWRLRTQPDPGLNGRQLIYPRGKVLGGSSSINGMIYMRGQARDYDGWAAITGEPAWGWQQVLPDFLAHEDHHSLQAGLPLEERALPVVSDSTAQAAKRSLLGSSSPWHAAGGEWRVEQQRLHWELLDAVAQAAQQAGIPATDDFNRGNNEGVGYFEVNQRRGWRWNAAQAFLHPIKQRRNLRVQTHTHVERLLLERDATGPLRCVGAVLLQGGQRRTVRVAREVILAAGAIGSPQILQLSGIGPGGLLQRFCLAVQHELPAVGAHLQDHLQIRAVFKVQGAKTLNTLANSRWGKAAIGLEYLFKRSGPMSMAPSQLGIFTKSQPALAHPNLQFHVQPLSLPAFGQPLHPFPAFTASVCNLNPSSRGTVHITSPDPTAAPAISPNYLSTPEDRQVAADSLRVARRIAAQPALQRYRPEEFKPGLQYQTDEELVKLAGDIATTIFHPVGTARMGRVDDPQAAVDPQLRVRGVLGLRVVDASVMPTITSGNTNSPTLMLAEKAARWILAG